MRTKFVATALFALALTASPIAAHAQVREGGASSDQRMDRVRTRCLAQIDRRQRALDAGDTRLDGARALTDAHRAALKQIDAQTSDGLSQLATRIQSDSTVDQMRTDCRSIVEDYRVFALVRPRARVVAASDRVAAAVTRLGKVADRLQQAIDKAKAEGRDTTTASQHLAAMRADTSDAAGHVDGVYDSVIHVTPAEYNANHDVLKTAIANVRAGRSSARDAVSEARQARTALRSPPA
ncbi:MAG: hypothetical protein QOJ00_1546 [Actinomycetota bacterium]|jgi:hypothetical protein